MARTLREDRLRSDFAALEAAKESSTIFDFESTGDPADRYTVLFRGKGIARDMSAHSDIEIVELHRCDIRLPYSYPDRGPDIRWLTPIFHPNVSFSGFINLREIGLTWEKGITLDVVCERLWDITRAAFMNLEKATNYAAKNWFEDENTLRLPVDHRPLRDKTAPASSNVIHYQRRSGSKVDLPAEEDADVFFIGNETPAAPPQQQATSPRRVPPRRSLQDDDDGIVFIDD